MKAVSIVLVLSCLIPILDGPAQTKRPAETAQSGFSGRILGLEGNDHVVVKAVGPRTYRATTRSEGRWSIAGVVPGAYTVTPIHARYTFEPAEMAIDVAESPIESVDFRAAPTEQ